MSVVEVFSLTLSIISLGVALISLIIVFWDHIYDDRILSRQVQDYYEAIEGLIFTFYMVYNLRDLITKGNGNDFLKNEYTKHKRDWAYYYGKVETFFNDFSKYFGFVKYSNHIISIKSSFSVEFTGAMFELSSNLPKKTFTFNPMFKNVEGKFIFEDKLYEIDSFLESLRTHWNENYSKRIFRKKLKPIQDFTLLIQNQ